MWEGAFDCQILLALNVDSSYMSGHVFTKEYLYKHFDNINHTFLMSWKGYSREYESKIMIQK